MSPRKTRRGAKSERINETLSETISKNSLDDTPQENGRKMRIRRQLTKSDSDTEQTPEIPKSRRKAPSETASKSSRSRKKLNLESSVLDDSALSSSTLNVTTRRTRRVKENETTHLDATVSDDTKSEKSKAPRARKKASKSDEESAARVTTKKRGASSSAKNSQMDTTEDNGAVSVEDTEVQLASSRMSRGKTTSPKCSKRRPRVTKQRLDQSTPVSSPMIVSLSPHRATKTPRKSPMNLGSPKSHAETSLRLSKTPRKLPIVEESPSSSEKSIAFSIPGTPKMPEQAVVTPKKKHRSPKSPAKLSKSPKIPMRIESSKKSKSPSEEAEATAPPVRKFSKSPKITMRTPKLKKKSPRVVSTRAKKASPPKRASKSPLKLKKNDNSLIKSPSPKKNSLQSHIEKADKSVGSPSMGLQLSRIDSPVVPSPTSFVSASPAVIVGRTSLKSPRKITPARSPRAERRISQGGESPRRSRSSGKRRAPITETGTPLRAASAEKQAKRFVSKSIILSSGGDSTPVEPIARKAATAGAAKRPLLSSTPRERIRRSLNLSPGLGLTPAVEIVESWAESSSLFSGRRGKRRSLGADEQSNALTSGDESFSLLGSSPRGTPRHSNGTYELDKDKDNEATALVENEQEKPANGTYELDEPKTPNLRRRKAAKRSISDLDTSVDDRAAKRTCRVRFAASPAPNVNVIAKTLKTATPGSTRFGQKRTTPQTHAHNGPKIVPPRDIRRRSNSVTNVSSIKTPVGGMKRRSNSMSAGFDRSVVGNKTTRQTGNSVNRSSKPRLSTSSAKKPETKTPVPKKVPNFVQIHQKKFAAMESLVDAKKRVEKRHLAIAGQIPTSLKRANNVATGKSARAETAVSSSVPINGPYNRFGFKLRKNDALKLVTQKQPPQKQPSDKKQNENRIMLKGVRTNRRFELIMKARNINL